MITGQFTAAIYAYLSKSGRTLSDALLDEAANRSRMAFRRQLMEERDDAPGVLRMSGGGHCARKQWFRFKGVEGEPLTPRVHVTFLTGDLLEVALSVLGRLGGLQLYGKADADDAGGDRLTMEIPLVKGGNYTVSGHLDDLLHDPETDETFVVEYKSMSEYSFRAFEKEGLSDDWGYKSQVSLYCAALNIKRAIAVGICKGTGHVCDHVVDADPMLVLAAKERLDRVLNYDAMPDRGFDSVPELKYNRSTKAYDVTGRQTINIVCQYCDLKKECWGDRLTMEMKGEMPNWILT